MKKKFSNLDRSTQDQLRNDIDLINFWSRYLGDTAHARSFISQCLKKIKTRRMMLRVKWYVDVADKMPIVKSNRPALQIIFLVAMAENIARRKYTKKAAEEMGSQKLVLDFFSEISPADKSLLQVRFKRALITYRHHQLRFTSIVRMLYQIRNDAVHGQEFWGFSLVDPERHTSLSVLTHASLGTRRRRRRVAVDMRLTYEDLRNIFARVALENIRTQF